MGACLLDTVAFLYFIGGDDRLPDQAISQIEPIENEVYLSVASLWEIAIKLSIGKLELDDPYEELIPREIEENQFSLLEISYDHTVPLVGLPFHNDHNDPFDRLIVAQGVVEELPIITNDSQFENYPVEVEWG